MEHRQRISRYRDELKGLAILWVVFFHALISTSGVLRSIQKIGYGGVDIFFFLTGFGLYYSLEKKQGIGEYWRRRMSRILPAYLPVILCWMALMFPGYGLSTVQMIRSAAGNLFLCGFWFGVPKLFNWYGSGLLLVLVLAPLVHGLLSKSARPGRTLFCMLGVLYAAGLCCVGLEQYMAVSRLPVFVLGMAFAMSWQEKLNPIVKRLLYALAFGLGVFIVLLCFDRFPELLLTYGMYWHPFVLITPPLCLGLAWLFQKAERLRPAFAPLRLLGQASFAIYLANIWLVELGKKYAVTGDLQWLGISCASLILGIGYHFLVEKAAGRFAPARQSAGV